MRRWLIVGVLVLVALGMAAWFGRDTYAAARIGTAYVAKHTCSCLYVAGRPAAACSRDYDAQAARQLKVQVAASSVTVSALGGLFSARAEFEPGFGCHLVN